MKPLMVPGLNAPVNYRNPNPKISSQKLGCTINYQKNVPQFNRDNLLTVKLTGKRQDGVNLGDTQNSRNWTRNSATLDGSGVGKPFTITGNLQKTIDLKNPKKSNGQGGPQFCLIKDLDEYGQVLDSISFENSEKPFTYSYSDTRGNYSEKDKVSANLGLRERRNRLLRRSQTLSDNSSSKDKQAILNQNNFLVVGDLEYDQNGQYQEV